MKAAIDKSKSWFVVRSNIKCEEKAATNLRLAGYSVYYPRERKEVQHKRTKTYHVKERPLMMRYLFVGQPKVNADWYTLRACEGVESVLGIDGRPFPVPVSDIEAIYLAEVDMQFDDTREARIHRKEEAKTKKETIKMRFPDGKEVAVLDGPFASFTATVEEVTKGGIIKALVAVFGRLSSVEFEPEQLSPLPKKRLAR